MSIGSSIVLIAIGAILRYAVTEHVAGIDVRTAGWILMVVGALALVLTLLFEAFGRTGRPRSGTL
ncbi:MAG TPA: DUF6458 family protein [Solirubrobacteraceae bacterium]